MYPPEEVRTKLLFFANLFASQKMWYNDDERQATERMIDVVQPGDTHCEEIKQHQDFQGERLW